MLLWIGPPVLSEARLQALLRRAQGPLPRIASLQAHYLHLVEAISPDAEKELSETGADKNTILKSILDYGDVSSFIDQSNTGSSPNTVFVIPRPGSISPWSSKATDIAKMCHLDTHISRIERGIVYTVQTGDGVAIRQEEWEKIAHLLHDRMTQIMQKSRPVSGQVFAAGEPRPLRIIPLSGLSENDAQAALRKSNVELGLALAEDEISYLVGAYVSGTDAMNRDPTDAELFMFAQVNSEHCRHKIFNASWTIDGQTQPKSLFAMIRNTEAAISGRHTISAYSDNAAVLEGYKSRRFAPLDEQNHTYGYTEEDMPILAKVETHNHPTAVSPFPGAATGSGGEIRDEGAVGRGSKPKAGLSGFTVSNLLIPGFVQPWETDFGKPAHISSALDIMIDGPLGACAFNNEFGRPALCGYFRTYSESIPGPGGQAEVRGYHKPIMIAGGLGNVRPGLARKTGFSAGAKIVVLGGPGLLIGLGGGAASSQASGASSAHLDFASVQRENPEMQRRCQQVIDTCVSLGDEANPIASIHDVGAGGLSNALPELVHDAGLGASFEIRDVLVDDQSMSPMEIWCNESQERYVLAITPEKLEIFTDICKRERCPCAVVGVATEEQDLVVTDRLFGSKVVDLKMGTLFGKPPKMSRADNTTRPLWNRSTDLCPISSPRSHLSRQKPKKLFERVLRLPSVGSKAFLITIGDRSVTGLVTRDQMVGPWQVPISDVAVTRTSYGFDISTGEAMAIGERTPLALINAAASARMAVGEALTNIAAASIEDIGRIKLSANWMSAASMPGEGQRLYEAVRAIGEDLCCKLGIGIPVGKDSMSMAMRWKEDDSQRQVVSPLSLIVTAFAPVQDISRTWTPNLKPLKDATVLLLVDLAAGHCRLGGSALAQTFKQVGSESPDVVDAATLKGFFSACQRIHCEHPSMVLSYHDRSDGGLFTTVAEMAFGGRLGVALDIGTLSGNNGPTASLFNEELGAVFQVRETDAAQLKEVFLASGVPSDCIHVVGRVLSDQSLTVCAGDKVLFSSDRPSLQARWSETSFRMQSLRDDALCAEEEFELIENEAHTGLFYDFIERVEPALPPEVATRRPRVAILREQGVNGHVEMAWAFDAAGFDAVDVHMSDILIGRVDLNEFRGIAACGGFSYGDVLGAGNGWAQSILLSSHGKAQFSHFFQREDSFALAVCNGCQMFAQLKALIPGAESWPLFKPNRSGRFEARVCMLAVESNESTKRSVFLRDMIGWKIPVAVAHGEGRATFTNGEAATGFSRDGLVGLRYVDSKGLVTMRYPLNPNGSPDGIAGVHTTDGRFLALMPHPERVVTTESNSWHPGTFGTAGPWFQMFKSARIWCGP